MKSREKRDKMLKIIFNFIKAYRYSDVFPYRGQTNKQGVFDLIK